jgi:hypothetical protein
MNDTQQITLSYELLQLLAWLTQNEPDKLKKLVKYAYKNGLKEEIAYTRRSKDVSLADTMQYTLVDFLNLFELLLQEIAEENTLQKVVEKKLLPALDHIDSTACDMATVQTSLEKATSKIEAHPQINPEELLFQELLRSWKPKKENLSN